MAYGYYNAGTVSVTAASKSVVGVGTDWVAANIQNGDKLSLAGQLPLVVYSVEDATHLTLRDAAQTTVTGADYMLELGYFEDGIASEIAKLRARLGSALDIKSINRILRLNADDDGDALTYYGADGAASANRFRAGVLASAPTTYVVQRFDGTTWHTIFSATTDGTYSGISAGPTGATGATGAAPWTSPAAWVTTTAYVAAAPSSCVTEGGSCYVCMVPHTAGTFATDLAAGYWRAIAVGGGTDVQDGTVTTAKLAAGAATNSKLADMATGTLKGRATASTGAPEDLTASQVRGIIGAREKLAASRTYYVATTGSDSNSGLSSDAPFLTIQAAVDAACSIDLSIYSVTISVAAGTYDGAVTAKAYIGAGPIYIIGDEANPSSIILQTTSGSAGWVFGSDGIAQHYHIRGVKIRSTVNSAACIRSYRGSIVNFQNVDFGDNTIGYAHVMSGDGGNITATGPYTISGSCPRHLWALMCSLIRFSDNTATVSGSPSFSTGFAVSSRSSIIMCVGSTYSGSASGSRYVAEYGGIISCGGSTAFFPGSTAGTGTSFSSAPYGLYY